MDDTFGDDPPPRPAPADLSAPLPAARGRPALTPEQRALNDAKYAEQQALYDLMPTQAKDYRFAIFDCRDEEDVKDSFKPLVKIQATPWAELGLKEPGALSAYLQEKFGPGRYFIEPQDSHGQRIVKFPFWVATTPDYEANMDDDFSDDRGDRRSRRRRREREYDDEDDFDDPSDRRSNVADRILATQQASTASAAQVMGQSKDMMSLMMLSNQEAQRQSREDAMRREDARQAQELEMRRQDALRREQEEKRRYDEDRKRDEERQRREDERRREDQKREDERREQDRRHEQKLAEERIAADKRFQLTLGLIPTLLPVVERIFKPAAPAADPFSQVLVKQLLDKTSSNDPHAAMQVMVEATKLGGQIQADQMRNAMNMQGELSKILMAKVMEQATGGGGRNPMEMVAEIVGHAATLAQKFIPDKPAPNPYVQAANARLAAGRPVAQQAPAAVPAVPAEQQSQAPAQDPAAPVAEHQAQPVDPNELTPEQQAIAEARLQEAVQRDPTYGVMRGLFALQNKLYDGNGQYGQLVQYTIGCMRLDLRVAILDADEARIMEICLPTIQAHPELMEWVQKPEVLGWIREFVGKLGPSIVTMFGPAPEQREQYIAAISAEAAAANAQAPQPAPVAPAAVEVPTAPATEPPPSEVPPTQDAAPVAEVINFPGTTPAEEPAQDAPGIETPPAPTTSGSHLDGDV